MILHFEMFSGKEVDSHHDIILAKLFCNLTQSANELIFVKILMSSAYKSTSQLKSSTTSFINKLKSRGPQTDS
jgi:hypothetical protein